MPRAGGVFRFLAADGPHTGEILRQAQDDSARFPGGRKTVRLRMIDVKVFHPALDGWFVDTGTRHFVRFVPDAEAVDVETEGRRARWDPVFAPVGANANFVSVDPDGTLRVRTFEKGVEGETLACGTGITAAAIAAYLEPSRADRNYFSDKFAEKPISAPPSTTPSRVSEGPATSFADAAGGSPVHYNIQARIDRLAVEFRPVSDGGFTDVYLIGPAEEIR